MSRSPAISRRDLLRAAGAAAVGGALAGCDADDDPYRVDKAPVPGTAGWARGEERFVATTIGDCGLRVRVVEGRAVSVTGLSEHPVSRGAVDLGAHAAIQMLYHPDRLRGPLRRVGPRGEGRFQPATWDAAIGAVAGAIAALRREGRPDALVLLDGEPPGPMAELWERFCAAVGTPHHVDRRGDRDGAMRRAVAAMEGVAHVPVVDFERSGYVLGFGAELLEHGPHALRLANALPRLRRATPGRRVKLTVVAARHAASAAAADEWVAIAPATEGALALGLAHALVRDGRHDAAFVDGPPPAWRDVLAEWPPERAAGVTGVPAATIERLAVELAGHPPAAVIADAAVGAASNGLATAWAIHALNALLGSVGRPGGPCGRVEVPLAPWPAIDPDAAARAGRAAPRLDGGGGSLGACLDGLIAAPTGVLGALLLHRSNPVHAQPEGARWREAFARFPLVVSFSPLPDESTWWADWVLPDHVDLERFELVAPAAAGVTALGLRQPVVPPLYDTRATGDVVVALAHAIGGAVAAAFPWADAREAFEARLPGLLEGPAGSIPGGDVAALLRGLHDTGVWWRAGPEGPPVFATRSGRPDLAGGEAGPPEWTPPRFAGDPATYPFVLVPYRGVEYAEGGARHLPWLRERPGEGRLAWTERAELHPADAAALGIADGAPVQVTSVAGSRVLRAKTDPGTRPGTVGWPLGHGPWPPAPDAPDGAGLVAPVADPATGARSWRETRVRVARGRA